MYEEKVDVFIDFLSKEANAAEEDIERMEYASMTMRFDMSTDHQQDKVIPCWNRSAQPGATYFMSNVIHYVHIICLHSCGHEAGFTRFSRNMVYTRSEEVNVTKTSDDIISTVADVLLGSKVPKYPPPPMFKSSCNKDGKVL